MGYGPSQDKVIATSLRKFEALKPIASHQKKVIDSLIAVTSDLHRTVDFQRGALKAADKLLVNKDVLLIDGNAKLYQAEKKSTRRGWTIAGLTLLTMLLGVAAVR